jgi:hypothetical protein
MRNLGLLLVAVSLGCGRVSAPPPEDASVAGTELSGSIVVAGGVFAKGDITIVDDGFEGAEAACADSVCVAGGLTP